ncbi:hypothetical protein [Winogradskyella luteola]|uniref:Uncharacterized protein n=1 Tax=Winogradskyella luteola TaxID=2828330 RepID=A0A9X1JR57_9FLAO|nr:hypothetical protein [Winogradskyella luteola]MBV7270534.1 hypothetical protein [Winogradskyella luteola]
MRIFKEQQRFNQIWIIALMTISILIIIGIIISEYINDPNSFSPMELVLLIGSLMLISGFIFLLTLTSRIDEKGIHYKFFPLHWKFKSIEWNDINKAYVRHYDAINEYGGWGFKGGWLWKKSKGRAINVSGNLGIQLELKNGKKLLIGTQKKEEAERILATYKEKTINNG